MLERHQFDRPDRPYGPCSTPSWTGADAAAAVQRLAVFGPSMTSEPARSARETFRNLTSNSSFVSPCRLRRYLVAAPGIARFFRSKISPATEAYRNRIPVTVASVELGGVRTYLGVPLHEGGAVVGIINLMRQEVRPFSEREIAIVQGFALQARVAIKNARLFNETREALERQTATSEILRVISRIADRRAARVREHRRNRQARDPLRSGGCPALRGRRLLHRGSDDNGGSGCRGQTHAHPPAH